MRFVFLILTVAVISFQNICAKQYRVKASAPCPLKFSAISAISAMLFFCVVSRFRLDFQITVLPYSLGFGLAYACAIAGLNFAISTGPLAISSLFNSYALLIPTMYGILILKEPVGFIACAGIFLLLLSLLLINEKGEKKGISLKWMVCILIAFLGNGMCSTIQKMQQIRFVGAYQSEFMVAALVAASVILTMIALLAEKGGGSHITECCKYASVAGIANGLTNLAVMKLLDLIPNALLFPTLSAGGIVIMFFVSVLLYQEKMSKIQKVGFAIGVVSVVFLNL